MNHYIIVTIVAKRPTRVDVTRLSMAMVPREVNNFLNSSIFTRRKSRGPVDMQRKLDTHTALLSRKVSQLFKLEDEIKTLTVDTLVTKLELYNMLKVASDKRAKNDDLAEVASRGT